MSSIQSRATDKTVAEQQTEQRARYMRHEITFAEYYEWLADTIGVTARMLPVPIERIQDSTDEHLNDIPLQMWDRMDYAVRWLANRNRVPWSLSDTVCVLKAVARREARRI